MCFLVLFNIPIARQIFVFLTLTFIPGIIVLKLLKIDNLPFLEGILLSVGFSLAFLLLVGIIINESFFFLKILKPLSLTLFTTVLNCIVLAGTIFVYFKRERTKILVFRNLKLQPSLIFVVSLPILSIIGALCVNIFQDNLILLITFIAISLLFIACIMCKKLFGEDIYPLALLMIAISLLFHSVFISTYIIPFGSDAMVEYSVFNNTKNNAYWSSTNPFFGDIAYGRLNAMLSITILPTIYSTMLNLDPSWTFKILYPIFFSLVPLGLYQIWQNYVNKKHAFFSAFVFMAQSTFYTEMLGLNRQMIAELFLVLLLYTMLNKKMKTVNRMICFITFSSALVTSHYSLAEIFLFFISFASISLIFLKRSSRNMNAIMVVLFFIIMFTWYIYISNSSAFDSLLSFGEYVYSQLGDFFNPASRGQYVLRGLGMEAPPSIWNAISRSFAYIIQSLIVIGFLGLVTKRVTIRIDKEYFMLVLAAMALLAMLIVVPGLAKTLNMTRFYHILLFYLAPLCVLGAEVIVKLIFKRNKELKVYILLIILLVPYFLFQSGFIYEITGSQSWSLPLSGYRLGLRLHTDFGFVTEGEVFGAKWLSKHVNMDNLVVYADPHIFSALVGYGSAYMGKLRTLTNVTNLGEGQFVYLGKLNVFYGKVISSDVWNTSDVLTSEFLSAIYTSGDCQVYSRPVTPP
jgi:uncharacterized membrane protein